MGVNKNLVMEILQVIEECEAMNKCDMSGVFDVNDMQAERHYMYFKSEEVYLLRRITKTER